MRTEDMTPEQVQQRDLEALKRELGVAGMVRFMQQFSNGQGDYSVERYQLLNHLTQEDIIAQINALQRRKSE